MEAELDKEKQDGAVPLKVNGTAARTAQRPGDAGDGEASVPVKKKSRARTIALGVIGVAAVGAAIYYKVTAGYEETDDAQLEADVVAVPARVGGVVMRVAVVENQVVKQGDLIAELDSAQHEARLHQAEAELASAEASAVAADAEVDVVEASARGQHSVAEATLKGSGASVLTTADDIAQARAALAASTANRRQAEIDLNRAKALFAENAIPRQRFDSAQTAFDAADANLAQAKARLASAQSSTAVAEARVSEAKARVSLTGSVDAQIAQARARAAVAHARVQTATATRDLARLDLSYTKIVAPRGGVASKKTISVGQMVSPGQPVVMIVPDDEAWVTANYKETQLQRLRVGQPAEIEVDAFPGMKLKGSVESLSGATGSRFSLIPADNATGNFVKVVQRVPVRVHLEKTAESKALRPGMSASVTVDVRR